MKRAWKMGMGVFRRLGTYRRVHLRFFWDSFDDI
jgi:hypothetical protein